MSSYIAFERRDVAEASAYMVIATMATVMRFVSRHITATGLQLDDWLALVALLSYLAFSGLCIAGSFYGDNYSFYTLPEPVLREYLWISYWAEILTPICITCIKLSILWFYCRLFKIKKSFRIWLIVTAVLCVLWCIACMFALIFQCIPVQAAWKPYERLVATLQGKCINFVGFIVGVETPNALLDLVMVFMPIVMIKSLQLPLRYKVLISLLFCLGGFVAVTGLIRIAIIYRPGEVNLSLLAELTGLQLLLGLLCANFPTMRPLFPKNEKIFALTQGWSKFLRSSFRRSTRDRRKPTNNSSMDDEPKLVDPSESHEYLSLESTKPHLVTRVEAVADRDRQALPQPGENEIRVHNEVRMT